MKEKRNRTWNEDIESYAYHNDMRKRREKNVSDVTHQRQ